ncbi:MAG: hypothetical protein K8T89_06550, partial [Planctomycetes bacterium]|nr:hypothetical protein [Planctomycetota bacterium]
METNKNELGRLNSDEWRDLQNCASRLEKSLKDGDDSIDLQRFLPPPDAPHRRVVLHELIKTELEIRYLQGQTRRLEEYIVRYPELGTAESLPINLLYEEYRVRRVHGDGPELEEYRTRFPIQFEGLKRLVEKEPVPLRAGGTARVSASQMRASIQFEKSDQAPAPATDRRDRKAARNLSLLQELNGYEKLDLLGHGEFGEVWKALAPGGVEVALKFITRNLDHEATRRELKALE